MALCEFHLSQQNALQKMTSLNVLVPEKKEGPFPVLYLLHGLSDDHTAWTRQTSLERYTAELPMIIVMPNGGRGFYCNSITDPRAAYETFITRDLIEFIDRTFNTIPKSSGRAIAGQSMGGYGAIKLALKYPQIFSAAISHSGALAFGSNPFDPEQELSKEWIPMLGPDPTGSNNDCFALADSIDRSVLPALRIDCGVDDFLIESNRSYHKHLMEIGIPHEYVEHPGAHTWEYWDSHIPDTIKFVVSKLALGNRKL